MIEALPYLWVLRLNMDGTEKSTQQIMVGCIKAVVKDQRQIVRTGPVAIRPEYQVHGFRHIYSMRDIIICYYVYCGENNHGMFFMNSNYYESMKFCYFYINIDFRTLIGCIVELVFLSPACLNKEQFWFSNHTWASATINEHVFNRANW